MPWIEDIVDDGLDIMSRRSGSYNGMYRSDILLHWRPLVHDLAITIQDGVDGAPWEEFRIQHRRDYSGKSDLFYHYIDPAQNISVNKQAEIPHVPGVDAIDVGMELADRITIEGGWCVEDWSTLTPTRPERGGVIFVPDLLEDY